MGDLLPRPTGENRVKTVGWPLICKQKVASPPAEGSQRGPKRVEPNWRIAHVACSRTAASKVPWQPPTGFAEVHPLLFLQAVFSPPF